MILCILIGVLIRQFFIDYNWSLWKWIVLLFIIVVINEKSGGFEKIAKWLRKKEAWLWMGLLLLLLAAFIFLEQTGAFNGT